MTKTDKEQNFAWVEDFRRVQLRKSARNPGLAALMSFFAMGLGQIYAGHIDRGIIFLSVHLFGVFTSYSLYSGGFMYDWLIAMLGSHVLVGLSYIVTVFFILLWIYNIKDAYYLSIFSSFRDWFEVERVLLPSMGVPTEMLLSSKNASSGLIENSPSKIGVEEPSVVKVEDDSVINVTASKTVDDDSDGIDNEKADLEGGREGFSDSDSTRELVFMNYSSWKLYAALTMVVCVGVGIGLYSSEKRKETSFQLSKDFALIGGSRGNQSDIPVAVTQRVGSDEETVNQIITSSVALSLGEASLPKSLAEKSSSEPKLITENIVVNRPSNNSVAQTAVVPQTAPVSQFTPHTTVFSTSKQEPSSVQTNLLQQQVHIVFTQDQVDSYVEQRMRALLAAQTNHKNRIPYDSPSDFTEDYLFSEVARNDSSSELPGEHSEIVVIQGRKESKILKKNPNTEPLVKVKPKILYEAADKGDDEVEIIIADESGSNIVEESAKKIDSVPFSPAKTEKAKVVVPDVNPSLPEKLKKEEEETKVSSKTDSPKAIIVAKKAEDDEEPDENFEKLGSDFPKEDTLATKKVEDTSVANETPEYRAQLEKIKERGAYEFYKGNWEAALPFYFEVLKYRRNAESFEMVGIIFEKMNRLSDAFIAYENAYELGLTNKNNTARLGLIAEKLGEYAKAQKYLEKAIGMSPKRADIILSYARCLDKQGESFAAGQVLAVLRDSTTSYAIKKAAEQEYQRIVDLRAKEFKEKAMADGLSTLTE